MNKTNPAKHLLVYADDDDDDLQLVKDAFALYEHMVEVCLFEDGHEVYNFLLSLEGEGTKPCLIILDINMPGMNGKELLQTIRATPSYETVPVILFTTSSQQHDYHFAQRHNAGFITKPMTFQQMDVIAEQFLSHCTAEVRRSIKHTR